jgi:translation initiation factor IF-1/Cu/Ag efflux protein CusF
MKRCRNTLVAASATLLAAACAAPPPQPMMRDSLVQKTATVESIDQASRLVTLRGEDGFARTVKVSNDVRNFPQIREGDKVVVSYYEAIAAEVKKPGEGVQGVEADVSAARADPGKMPAASSGVMLRTTVTIESVDKESNMVTFRNADGMLRTAEIQTPEGQKFIKGLKKGDQVEIVYTEAFAIEVKPAG